MLVGLVVVVFFLLVILVMGFEVIWYGFCELVMNDDIVEESWWFIVFDSNLEERVFEFFLGLVEGLFDFKYEVVVVRV